MTDIGATGPTGQTILTAICCLFGVVALILFTARLGRGRISLARHNRSLHLCETLPLDTRRRIHLIECDGRRYLLLTGGGHDQVIGQVPTP